VGAVCALLVGLWGPAGRAEAPPGVERPSEAEDEAPLGLDASVFGGATSTGEAGVPRATGMTLGASVGYRFAGAFRVWGSFRDTLSRQPYTSVPGAGLSRLTLQDEQFQDARLGLSFNTLATVTDRVSLDVYLAPRFVNLHNQAFRAWGFAGEFGGGVGFHPVPSFHIEARAGFTMSFTGTDQTLAAHGLWKYANAYQAGLRWDFRQGAQRWSVFARWQGDKLVFEHTSRFYQAAVAGLGFAI